MHIDHSSYIGVYGSLFRSLNSFVIFAKTCGFVKRSYTIPAATLDAYKAPLSPMEVPPLAVACHVCGEHQIGQHAVVNRQVGIILLTSPVSEDALSSASFHLSLGETPKIIASS